jgi:hypothetical protein
VAGGLLRLLERRGVAVALGAHAVVRGGAEESAAVGAQCGVLGRALPLLRRRDRLRCHGPSSGLISRSRWWCWMRRRRRAWRGPVLWAGLVAAESDAHAPFPPARPRTLLDYPPIKYKTCQTWKKWPGRAVHTYYSTKCSTDGNLPPPSAYANATESDTGRRHRYVSRNQDDSNSNNLCLGRRRTRLFSPCSWPSSAQRVTAFVGTFRLAQHWTALPLIKQSKGHLSGVPSSCDPTSRSPPPLLLRL